jgi:uncharacterized SAM-binding protein YcdF (DUF218 family)
MAVPARSRRKSVSRLNVAALVVVLAFLAWTTGFLAFANAIPDKVEDAESLTDAIVVLTGGSARLEEGLTLLAAGKGKKLFVSGVYQGVEVQHLLELSRRRPEELSCCIALGYAANSTIGNALETAEWLEDERFTSIRLVTANYHMPRSLLEFRYAMPNVRIVPHAVFPEQFKLDAWWQWPGSAHLIFVEYLKYLAASARHTAEFLLA